ICSDVNKPDGVFILEAGDVEAFLATLPVRKIPGVGPRMAEALGKFGIRFASDMRRYSPDFFRTRFGRPGLVLLERAMGRDPRRVEPVREAKSESAEETLAKDTRDLEQLRRILLAHAEKVGRRLRSQKLQGRTVTLKVKYADFTQITRSKTLDAPVASTQGIYGVARELLEAVSLKKAVRLLGVGVSNFGAPRERLTLLSLLNGGRSPEFEGEKRRLKLDRTLDALRERFGEGVVARGALAMHRRDGLAQGQDQRQELDPQPSGRTPEAGNLRG
ncbi:MAG: DNA polymerase IV, partial [Desulfovibrio sp.]|nr:DNA polymerase IV [Desulfovibrio sp.]